MTPLYLVKRAPWYVANDAHAKDDSDASEACNGSLAVGWVGSKSFTATCSQGLEYDVNIALIEASADWLSSQLETDCVSNALGFEKQC